MEPTLRDGCWILINQEKREPEHGKIFVIRTEDDEVIVKRTILDEEKAGWWPATTRTRKHGRRGRGPDGANPVGGGPMDLVLQPAVEPEEQQDTPTGVSEDVKSTVLVNRGVRDSVGALLKV